MDLSQLAKHYFHQGVNWRTRTLSCSVPTGPTERIRWAKLGTLLRGRPLAPAQTRPNMVQQFISYELVLNGVSNSLYIELNRRSEPHFHSEGMHIAPTAFNGRCRDFLCLLYLYLHEWYTIILHVTACAAMIRRWQTIRQLLWSMANFHCTRFGLALATWSQIKCRWIPPSIQLDWHRGRPNDGTRTGV